MDEMQITPEQFEVACLEGKNMNAVPKDEVNPDGTIFSFNKGLFQQIWAANDIRIFIRMMVQRNVEIQLQALDLIERRQASLTKDDNSDEASSSVEVEVDEKETEEIEKSVEKEIEAITEITDLEGTDEEVQNDKFQRLNLFFEQEKVSRKLFYE